MTMARGITSTLTAMSARAREDNEIEGGGLQAGVQLDHPDDQHVAHYGAEPDENLHSDVGNAWSVTQPCC